jgi:hypothetical protein
MKILTYLIIINALFNLAVIGLAGQDSGAATGITAENATPASQRKILFTEDDSLSVTFRVRENHPRRKAIEYFEQNGSPEAVEILGDFLTHHGSERKLKQLALSALGRIGTPEAVKTILQFEAWSRQRLGKPAPFHFGRTEHASDHFQDIYLDPIARTTDSQGKTWAVFPWGRYGQQRMWLTSSEDGETWAQPVALDLPEMPRLVRNSARTFENKCQLTIDNDKVIVTCDGQPYEASIKESLKDSDSDGLPDIVEADLQTDPIVSDTDEDGIADGRDSNPLTPRYSNGSDESEIRQAVFGALFATANSTDAIVIVDRGEFAEQEYEGFAGPVLRSAQSRAGFVNITNITVTLESPTTASARISDWEGSLAASMHEAKLKKINGKWIIVEFGLTMIS